jgi:hypothetical protein
VTHPPWSPGPFVSGLRTWLVADGHKSDVFFAAAGGLAGFRELFAAESKEMTYFSPLPGGKLPMMALEATPPLGDMIPWTFPCLV